MNWFIKLVAAFLAGWIVLFGCAFLYLRIKYPSKKLEAMALTALEAKLHREVRVGGFSLNPFAGVRLSGFQLSNRPSFADGVFIQCDSFTLRPSLLPLLLGRMAISRIVLDSPVIRIVRNQDKTFNFSDLSESSPAPAAKSPTPSVSAVPFLLTVDRLTIKNGRVLYLDRTDGSQASLEELNLTVRNFSMTQSFPVRLSVTVHVRSGVSTLSAPLEYTGTASLPFGLQGILSMSSVTHTFYEGHDLVVRCDLKGSKADLASIQGTAEFSMGHGGVHPGPFMNAIASVLGPSLSQLTYDSVRARALFEKGIVRVENGELNGSLTILFHGTYVVAANGLDFLLNIKLPKKSSSSFIGWKYSMPVDVIIGGTLSHPTCHLKTSQMIGSALNKVKQHIGGAVNNILKNSIGQILNSR